MEEEEDECWYAGEWCSLYKDPVKGKKHNAFTKKGHGILVTKTGFIYEGFFQEGVKSGQFRCI
jgi:hypothetical protein